MIGHDRTWWAKLDPPITNYRYKILNNPIGIVETIDYMSSNKQLYIYKTS